MTLLPDVQTPWLSDDEQRMWRSFQTMRRALDRGLERQLFDESGLSSADFGVLVPVSEAPGHRLRARELVRVLNWDRSRLSHHLRRMEKRNLIERLDCPGDARGTIIALTPTGWQVIQGAAPAHVSTVRSYIFDVLSPDEVAMFTELTERISARIAEQAAQSCAADPCAAEPCAEGAAEPCVENAAEPCAAEGSSVTRTESC